MSKSTSPYPQLSASGTGTGVVSHAGAVVLLRTAEKTGLTAALSTELARFRKPLARHDPGKIVLDLATALAIGGDCLADIAQLRAHPELFGAVASDPTVSRLIGMLAADAETALDAIDRARATARAHAWTAAGRAAPDDTIDEQTPLVIDIDATLVTAHSDKESAAPNSNAATAFIHCVPSSTTVSTAPVNPSRCCYARGTRDRTPPLITSPWCRTPSRSCPTIRDIGPGRRCWCASTAPAAPMG